MNIDFIIDGDENNVTSKYIQGDVVPRVGDVVSLGTIESDGPYLLVGKVIKVEWYFNLSENHIVPQTAVYLERSITDREAAKEGR